MHRTYHAGMWVGKVAAYSPFNGQPEAISMEDRKSCYEVYQCCVEERVGSEEGGVDRVVRWGHISQGHPPCMAHIHGRCCCLLEEAMACVHGGASGEEALLLHHAFLIYGNEGRGRICDWAKRKRR